MIERDFFGDKLMLIKNPGSEFDRKKIFWTGVSSL